MWFEAATSRNVFMKWFALLIPLLLLFFWLVLRIRRSSITGEQSRNKHFKRLAKGLELQYITDHYFVQLEGERGESRVIVYPHNFEGPGLITLLYTETRIVARERNWIEPNLSLGRALVEWKRQAQFDFEIAGEDFAAKEIVPMLQTYLRGYPYVAVTLPGRFSFSPLLQQSLSSWKNYVVFLAIDAGKRPSSAQIEQALRDAAAIASMVHHSVTLSDNTG
jgi:hypothetical protein